MFKSFKGQMAIIVTFQELWLEETRTKLVQSEWTWFTSDEQKGGRGLGVGVSNKIGTAALVSQGEFRLSIRVKGKQREFIVTSIYISPSLNKTERFHALTTIPTVQGAHLIVGDFNVEISW